MGRVTALGQVIREKRQAQGLSQEKLAELAGIHRNFVGLIEHGATAPSADTIFSVADALGIAAWELFREAEGRVRALLTRSCKQKT